MSPRSNRFFGILMVLVLTIFAIYLVYLDKTHPDQPEAVVKSQLEAVKAGKWTEAYYSFSSKEFQASTSLEEFKRYIRAFPEIQKESTISVDSTSDVNNLKDVEIFISNQHSKPIKMEYKLIKEDEKWKILNFRVAIEEKNTLNSTQQSILTFIEEVLKLIKNGEYEKVYNAFTSPAFKKDFSLDAFKDFIKSYPIMAVFTYSELLDFEEENELSIVKIRFENSSQNASTAFTVKKISGSWKIQNIEMLGQEVKANLGKEFNEEEIALPIKQMLYLIKNRNSEKAYQLYTSQAFKDSTTLQNFQLFIESNPILVEYKLPVLKKLQFNNNIGEYTVLLEKPPEKTQEALFSLIKEKGEWKVLQIQLTEHEE